MIANFHSLDDQEISQDLVCVLFTKCNGFSDSQFNVKDRLAGLLTDVQMVGPDLEKVRNGQTNQGSVG
jgi:hypothetical protein